MAGESMADEHTATIRIRRPGKVTTDERGRTVWTGEIETAELELVSTAELKQILASSDAASVSAIERMASGGTEGVLARDPATGLFEIVSETDLKAMLEEQRPPGGREPPRPGAGADPELALASTQVLRKMLKSDGPKASKPSPSHPPKPKAKRDAGGGFDPYNSG